MNKKLLNLQYALGRLYPVTDEQIRLAELVNVNVGNVSFNNRPITVWSIILKLLDEARRRELVQIALVEKPNTPEFLAYLSDIETIEPVAVPALKTSTLDNKKVFEKLTGSQSTLLPIAFLELGLIKARSVCLVKIGHTGKVGTGFLTANNLLVTNNHVFNDAQTAAESSVVFNFQDTADGNEMGVSIFSLSADEFFKTNVSLDYTVVKIQDNAFGSANSQFGALALSPIEVKKLDVVNIIQHPQGQKKQIALYHNMVTEVAGDTIQYLTDTMPGSSGSPVFDTKWNVVALHHAGAYLPNAGPTDPKAYNEGIRISRIIEDMKL